MDVKEIIKKAQEAGANIGEAYDKQSVVAEQVEGKVEADPRGATYGYRLVVTDSTGTIRPKISTSAYQPGKVKYDLAIMALNRDITLNDSLGRPTGQKLEKGLKQLRAI